MRKNKTKFGFVLTIGLLQSISSNAQCAANQTVNLDIDSVCAGNSRNVILGSSETGRTYFLRNNADNSTIGLPISGTGSSINFSTENVYTTTTYNVLAAQLGKALDFDGNDDVVTLPQGLASSIVGESTLTFEAWINMDAIHSEDGIWSIQKTGDGDWFWDNRSNGEDWMIGYNTTGSGFNYYFIDNPLKGMTGKWVHIASVYDGNNIKLYRNGVLFNTSNPITGTAVVAGGSSFVIGAYAGGSPYTADMKFDEFRIWTTARTQSEIASNMNSCLSAQPGLLAYYKFEDGAGTTLADSSGNGFDGTLTNMDPATDWIDGTPVCGCSVQMLATPTLRVDTIPNVNAGINQIACIGSQVTFSGTGADAFSWDNGIIDNVPFAATTSFTLTVTGTNITGCSGTDQAELKVWPSPLDHTVFSDISFSCNNLATPIISLDSSETGIIYYLKDEQTGYQIGNAKLGTGDTLTFPATIDTTTTFSIYAAPQSTGLSFDGIDDKVIVSPGYMPGDINNISALTIEMWINIDSANDDGGIWGIENTGDGDWFVANRTDSTQWLVGYNTSNSGGQQSFFMSSPLSGFSKQWVHVAEVYDGSSIKFYRNGELFHTENNITGNMVAPAGPFFIGRYAGDDQYCVAMKLDEFRIWAVARTQTEIQNSMHTCLNPTNDLITYYNFETGYGTEEVVDLSGYEYNAGLIDMDKNTAWVNGVSTCSYCGKTMPVKPTVYIGSPNVNAGVDTIICNGNSIAISGSGAISYSWNNGVTNGIPFTPTTTNTYIVTGTDINGCQNTDSLVITVNTLPIVNAGNDTSICNGNAIAIAGSGANSYSWNNGVTNGIAFTPTTTNTYIVTGTDNNGCQNTDSLIITVNILPNVIAGNDTSICNGSAITISGSGANSYSWNNSVTNEVAFSPSFTNTYIVTGTDINGCQNTDSLVITVNALPTVNAGSDTAICNGNAVAISGSGANSYSWNNGVTNGVAFSPGITNTYIVTGIDINGCQNMDSVIITVNDTNLVSMDTLICDGDSVLIAGQYQKDEGVYYDILTNNNGCDSTLAFQIIFKPASACLPTSINNDFTKSENNISIYPNPNFGVLNINIPNIKAAVDISIYNSIGKIVYQSYINKSLNIDFENMSPGIYYVIIPGYKPAKINLVR